jgi:DNA-binding transcriptional ArsR family regulator
MGNFEAFLTCPVDHKTFSIVFPASTSDDALMKILKRTVKCPHKPFHEFTPSHADIKGIRVYPPKQREIITSEVTAPRQPTEREAPTQLVSAEPIDNTIAVTVGRGEEFLSITFPHVEVEAYTNLMRVAQTFGQVTMRNAIIAFLLAHGGGTKTAIAGFLSASGRVLYFMRAIAEVTPSTVGEALSRLTSEGILYRFPATFLFTIYPLGRYGKLEKVQTAEILGEPVYGISEATRIRILERSRFEKHLAWWNIELLKPPPPTLAEIKKPVEYEWIVTTQPVPRFRAAEDMKFYGPLTVKQTVKLPLVFAYFLVRTGFARWLNPKKESVQEAEEMFKYQAIAKVKRQATLGEY